VPIIPTFVGVIGTTIPTFHPQKGAPGSTPPVQVQVRGKRRINYQRGGQYKCRRRNLRRDLKAVREMKKKIRNKGGTERYNW